MPVAVKYGLYEDLASLTELPIQEVREKYQKQWNMSAEAIALVKGKEGVREVSDSYTIQDGDIVEFVKSYTIFASNEA